jgi:Ca-activated chloride channel homolog
MNTHPKNLGLRRSATRGIRSARRGATAILIVSMLFVFVLVAAFTIDYAYMQLVRAELRVATDAAAKAGAEALARTEDSEAAIDQAVQYGAFNRVAGVNLEVARDDVLLGRVAQDANGRWQFQAGVSPFNSVRVDTAVQPPLFFGRILGRNNFAPTQHAVAGQQQVDVCLCLDRSGSMLFDMSGADFVYPPNNPNLINFTAWGSVWRNHLSPPHPTNSRWAVLARAVDDFFTEVQAFSPPPSVSLVSWGSNYTMPIAPSTFFPASRLDVALSANAPFPSQRTAVNSAIAQMGNNPIMGATNLSAGLDAAVAELTGPNARTLTNKVVLLLTDGMWNDGRHPLAAGADARDAGVTVHTVTMLTAFQPDIQQLAQMTGGLSYTTSNETQLRAAFREIAKSLQVVMIE